jgi:hypothetical protein
VFIVELLLRLDEFEQGNIARKLSVQQFILFFEECVGDFPELLRGEPGDGLEKLVVEVAHFQALDEKTRIPILHHRESPSSVRYNQTGGHNR